MTNKHNTASVGTQLQLRRQQLGLTLHKVEVATKIRGRYLRAIESSNYADLPNDIYSRGFVRQYAQFLGLNAQQITHSYQLERGKPINAGSQGRPRALELHLGATSRWAASLVALGAVAVVMGYLLWQFSSLTAAPVLKLTSPDKDGVVSDSAIEVSGRAAAGADVLLNEVLLPSDVNGNFKTTLILQPGINEVSVVAKNKLGKQTKVTRNILSRPLASAELPKQAIDGVAVLLRAKSASRVTVVADGKKVFDGTLAQGGSRLVTARQNISLVLSDAAAVSARLTNSLLADYNLGALGSAGAQRSIDLNKDTKPLSL